jgi:hypothetical protein
VAGFRGANLLTDCPQEGSELASNRRCRNRDLLAIGHQPTVAGDSRTCAFQAMLRMVRERSLGPPRKVSLTVQVGPCPLDPSRTVALGRAFLLNEAEKSHQLLGSQNDVYRQPPQQK